MPSPLTPIAPINRPSRYKGKPPGKIVIPLGKFGSGASGALLVVKKTPLRGFVMPAGRSEKNSCILSNGPGAVPTMPGGYRLCARKPTVRAEYARFVLEK